MLVAFSFSRTGVRGKRNGWNSLNGRGTCSMAHKEIRYWAPSVTDASRQFEFHSVEIDAMVINFPAPYIYYTVFAIPIFHF